MTPPDTRRLAERILGTYGSPPADLFPLARRHLIDYVGVTVAGTDAASVQPLLRAEEPAETSAKRAAHFFGSGKPMSWRAAALLNGTAAHAHDFDDDDSLVSIGHPSTPVLAAAWAAAEALDVRGESLLAAYIAGVETVMQLGNQVNPRHYLEGWHSTATLGVFGATAAAGALMGLTAEQLTHALNLAASLASGLKSNFGTDTKPIQVGAAAREGLWAAELASHGATAAEGVLFGPGGFCEVYQGEEGAARGFDEWGSPFHLESPGVSIKRYPCCSSTHTALDALLSLKEETGWTREEVDSIEVWVGEDIPDILRYDYPATSLEAKFSLKYCLAAAMARGVPTLAEFRPEALGDPVVQALMPKVHTRTDSGLARSPTGVTVESRVQITHTSGEVQACTVSAPRGSPSFPLTEKEVDDKFLTCVREVLGDEDAARALEALHEIDQAESIRAVVAGLVRASATGEEI